MPEPARDVTGAPMAEGGAHVIVTIESIYSLLLEVRDGVRDVTKTGDETAEKVRDHEARLRAVERKIWLAAGMAGGLGAGISQLVGMIGGQ